MHKAEVMILTDKWQVLISLLRGLLWLLNVHISHSVYTAEMKWIAVLKTGYNQCEKHYTQHKQIIILIIHIRMITCTVIVLWLNKGSDIFLCVYWTWCSSQKWYFISTFLVVYNYFWRYVVLILSLWRREPVFFFYKESQQSVINWSNPKFLLHNIFIICQISEKEIS